MDRQYIDDHHIIARYLADRLPEPERDAFEAYYLEHPDLLREIEAAARFKSGLAQLRDSGELGALLEATPWYARWRYLAIAAAAILVIVELGDEAIAAAREPDHDERQREREKFQNHGDDLP